VVLFQEKVDLFKIENSMNMACKACQFLGGSGGMPPPQKILNAAKLNLVAILANNCMFLDATN